MFLAEELANFAKCKYFVTADNLEPGDSMTGIFCQSLADARETAKEQAENDPGIMVIIWDLANQTVESTCVYGFSWTHYL